MFCLAPSATEEETEELPNPPQELEGGVWSAPNFEYNILKKL